MGHGSRDACAKRRYVLTMADAKNVAKCENGIENESLFVNDVQKIVVFMIWFDH